MTSLNVQSKSLYEESKLRLCERIAQNIQSIGSVTRQIVKGSKSCDILSQTNKSFASHENAIENTSQNIKKMNAVTHQLQLHLDGINKSCEIIASVAGKVKE